MTTTVTPEEARTERGRKVVAALQRAIDELPYGSGDLSVAGVPGLIVRCGARTKVYRLRRRVFGRLVWRVLGEMSLAAARRTAMREWIKLRHKSAEERITLSEAWDRYLEEKPLADKTMRTMRYNFQRYLAAWKRRTLDEIGADRAGVRALLLQLARRYGPPTADQVNRELSAVYRYFRKIHPELPECPTVVVDLPRTKPRDWAMSDDELRAWWAAVSKLHPVRRTFWLTVLLTGARRGSVDALRWADIDFHKRVIHFRKVKGGRTYSVPAPDRLLALLACYRNAEGSTSEWAFPSPRRPGAHLVYVRDDHRGVPSAHRLRHTYRTRLVESGATPDQAKLLMGHSLGTDVSSGYITAPLLIDALRPLANRLAEVYAGILGWDEKEAL